MKRNNYFFEDRSTMFDALTVRISEKLAGAIARKGKATFVVSGGSTPIPLFERLSKVELPWELVTVTLADERWVPFSSTDSNERMVKEKFLVNRAGAAQFFGLYSGHADLNEGCVAVEAGLRRLSQPFDVVFLGMGNDGHTASLFPGGDHLVRALDVAEDLLCCPMHAPGAPQPRITLTLRALLNCNDLLLVCTGAEKLDVYHKAGQAGPVEVLPIRAVMNTGRLAVYWAP